LELRRIRAKPAILILETEVWRVRVSALEH
jgi:hypothetical protein